MILLILALKMIHLGCLKKAKPLIRSSLLPPEGNSIYHHCLTNEREKLFYLYGDLADKIQNQTSD